MVCRSGFRPAWTRPSRPDTGNDDGIGVGNEHPFDVVNIEVFLDQLFGGRNSLRDDVISAEDRFLRPVSSLRHNLGNFLNDSAASLGIMPLLGKWERQAEQFLHVNFGTAHGPS